MSAYYNEFDPKAAAWLRELIKGGHIAPGEVDERSIEDVRPGELAGYTQCHFFAGIGGWSYALRLAGVADSERVWTGSCPCQPFSAAGKGAGFADERHLWPAWFHLIRECRPQRIFGEQVANALPWLDLVQTDLEGEDYAFWAAIVGAHSVGAPHIRQRLYWVGHAESSDRRLSVQGREPQQDCFESGRASETLSLGDTQERRRRERRTSETRARPRELVRSRSFSDLADARHRNEPDGCELAGTPSSLEREVRYKRLWANPWDGCEFVPCTDGKWRPVEPGTFPLAYGIPGRVGLLRGYGNAIVPQVAAAFIQAYGELV